MTPVLKTSKAQLKSAQKWQNTSVCTASPFEDSLEALQSLDLQRRALVQSLFKVSEECLAQNFVHV